MEEAVEGDETQPAIDEAEPADPDQPERGTLGDLIQAFKARGKGGGFNGVAAQSPGCS